MMKPKAWLLPFVVAAGCAAPPDENPGAIEDAPYANPRVPFSIVPLTLTSKLLIEPPPAAALTTRPAAFSGLHFLPAETEKLYRSFFPLTDDPFTNALKDRAAFYNEETMPALYQVWDEGRLGGLQLVSENQATANREFPWAGPAGTLPGHRVKTLRFVKLDRPIHWFTRFDGTAFAGFDWRYPVGTVFGEILLVTDPDGFDHPAELRTRRKNSDGEWTPNAFRPFPQEKGFQDAIRSRGFDFEPSAAFARALDSGHENRPFRAGARFVRLPRMPPSLVASLLDHTPFESARYKSWSAHAHGPTASRFSIVPADFLGGLIPVNRESCARCHEDAGRVVNLQGDARWRLRGNDRIFSFHIFSADSRGLDVRLNPHLTAAGLLTTAKE